MKVLFESEHARLWLDGHSPILYSNVLTIPQKMEELKRLCSVYSDAIKDCLKNYTKIYIVSDFSEVTVAPPLEMVRFYANFLPRLKNSGIVFKAFIKPRGPAEQRLLNEVVNSSILFNAASYDRFEEALSAINILRQTESLTRKSLLGRIMSW